jgi:hypothetical protein
LRVSHVLGYLFVYFSVCYCPLSIFVSAASTISKSEGYIVVSGVE